MRRMVAVCAGDREQARGLVIRGLGEIADEIEAEGGNRGCGGIQNLRYRL